ncbi:uncharacterized protein LOC122501466 [Leptopilina heterotoma]|uniref:uncharacterized protein LOC122501466 n=1 Tax=Leptopilina heterotoma TaxID=63436 RepID=UPI001CA85F9F|nr:uncharacterized protein LOC122501466 [Leptopilina heterotoma]
MSKMVFRSKEILILLSLITSAIGENTAEEIGRNSSLFDNDVCTLYDYSEEINNLLFKENYKPLVVVIAAEFIDGINRVKQLTQWRRILPDNNEMKNSTYFSHLYHTIQEHFYLFKANNQNYFVYPVNILDNVFTIYFQKMLLNDSLGVTFNFVNVLKGYSFFEDIFIPLNPNWPNCTLSEYVNNKLQRGESFSELFELREQLFGNKESNYFSIKAQNNYDICDSNGFNFISQSESLWHFNSLLQQIQNNANSAENEKKISIVEKSLSCLQSRHLEVTDEVFDKNINCQQYSKCAMIGIDYLNWINQTVSSLSSNDTSFGNLCEYRHKIKVLELFCFIKNVTGITSQDITASIDTLKRLVANSLISQLEWFNDLISLYKYEYITDIDLRLQVFRRLSGEIQNVNENWGNVMSTVYNYVEYALMRENDNIKHSPTYNSIDTIYKHWETIDDLIFDVKFKKLVIIVVDHMRTGLEITKQINASRVLPKLKREDLHHTEQFLYEIIMKNIYLIESNDTHYYIYPFTVTKQFDTMTTYFEYKMINDYSKVLFYFVNFSSHFSFDQDIKNGYNDLVIPALPMFCKSDDENCEKHFVNPYHLIKLHKEFEIENSAYFRPYATFYEKFSEFLNDHDLQQKYEDSFTYSNRFYNYSKQVKLSYYSEELFKNLQFLYSQEISKNNQVDLKINKLSDLYYYERLITSFVNRFLVDINRLEDKNFNYICSDNRLLKVFKLYCFIKINYIEGMLKVVNKESDDIKKAKALAQNSLSIIRESLFSTNRWIAYLRFTINNDYKNNENSVLRDWQTFYSNMPKNLINNNYVSKKIFLIFREDANLLKCQETSCVIP